MMQKDFSYHSQSKEKVVHTLRTSFHGLSKEEAKARLHTCGKNVIKEEKISWKKLFFRQFNSPLIFILIVASLISLTLQEFTDFSVIISLVFINALIGFWQEMKAATSLAALRKLTETKNRVVRDGKMALIPASDLVPGDCVLLHQGEVSTADIRLIETASLQVDESTITGESLPVPKDHEPTLHESALPYEWTNMVLTGSKIVRGTAKGIVVLTGKDTYLAHIGKETEEESPPTPLQQAIALFAKRYVILILSLLALMMSIGVGQGRSLLELFYMLLATLVSAVPEGLPIVITVVMVLGAHLLRKKQTLIRTLPSVETLGSTTILATDKTGTITEGKLLVKETYAPNPTLLEQIAVLCNDAQEGMGDPLDVALLEWSENSSHIRSKATRLWDYPFDQKRMMMAARYEVGKKQILFVKGAYESLRSLAQSQANLDSFDEVDKEFLKKGYRVLAFAIAHSSSSNPNDWDLSICGLIGFIDPPKKGVPHAVSVAKKAGIHVLMITGDHPETAQSIAHEVGIWKKGDRVVTGKEIEKMTDEELVEALTTTTVLARILPEHKHRVVKLLQNKEEIVAVTGDGINDMPALKAANIGIAMGGGADAAKSVAQMVLVDDNFSVIVDAIKNARVIAANIRKVIYYLLSTSIQELSFLFLAILTSLPIPLSAIQILWINLVTDGVMDKTFPFAKEEGDVMKKTPKKIKDTFLDRTQLFHILFFGLIQGLLCFFLYRALLPMYSFQTVSTILFTSIVTIQWANGLQAQKEEEPFFYNLKNSFTINPAVFIALPIGCLLQGAIFLFPTQFKSVVLTPEQLLFPIISFFIAFALVEVRKWIHILFKMVKS